eukprot:g13374.t1
MAAAPTLAEDDPRWVTYPGGQGPGEGKHIVLIAGDEEYRSEESMPQLGKIFSKHFGFKCTVLFSQDPKTGEIDPDNQTNIPGLEVLKTADLMLIVTRFRNLPDEQMQQIDGYLKTGKPVVGMRPATHAFKIPKGKTFHKYSFNSGVKGWEGGFGRQVFGETWAGHHVGNKQGYIRGIVAEDAKDHPIVRGLEPGEIGGKTGVYRVKLPMKPEATPIVLGGALQGLSFDQPLRGDEKNNPMMPVAWTHLYEIEPGMKGRAFVTTMGASQDLLVAGFRQMMAPYGLAESHQDLWVTYPGGEGPGQGKHIVLIAGDDEYRSEESLPMLGKVLSVHHGFTCTVLFPINPDTGKIEPSYQKNIPGLEKLNDADLLIMCLRFRDLPDEQMKHLDTYIQSGKPMIALRTSTHAFNIKSSDTYKKYSWRNNTKGWQGGFGKQVLGETWVAHHGKHKGESTRGIIPDSAKDHPINRGIEPGSIWGDSDVYTIKLPLPGDSEPVVMGAVLTGMKPDDAITDRKGKNGVPVNDPMMPLTWTKTYETESGKKARVLTSTLGAATDLVFEGSRRMVVNGVYWALEMENHIPEAGTNVELAALELNEGDSVIVVGNTFAERLALSGYLDAMIHAANPDKNIVVRSIAWSGDEVDEMPRIRDAYAKPWKERARHATPREHSVPTGEFYLKRHEADVVIMCYGMSESFDGLTGVDQFAKDLAKEVEFHQNNMYNGATRSKVVLVSPIAHEDLESPNLPTGDTVKQRNAVLKAYTAAMRSVANDKGALFIDLHSVEAEGQLTNNGIAPNEYGCFVYAGEMAKQLGWWDGKAAADPGNAEDLRQVAYDKHYHWRHRYRATNTEYVWGRRHKPFGIVNFPPELLHLDSMVAAREKAIWEMDKPSVAQVFAKAPGELAIWEATPLTYDYPGDEWKGVDIPVKDIRNDKKAGDASGIDAPEKYIDTFKVAEGFQVNLFACEEMFPELANPLAMSFDYKGRLWVLCAPTYPHPYPGKVTDCKLIILDDTDNDGVADKSTIFARYMNIPTCFIIEPNGVVYIGQAPDLWKFTDTDGDDVADTKEMVYSGFGMCDSHHSISAGVMDPNGGMLMLEGVFTRTNVETPYGTQRTRDAAIWRFDPRTHKLIAVGHTSHPNPWGQTYDKYGQSILMDTSGQAQYNFSSLLSAYVGLEKPKKGPPVVKRGRPTAGSDIIYSAHWPEEYQGVYVHSQCIGFLGTHLDKLKTDGSKNSGYYSESMPQPILSSEIGNYRPVCSEVGQDGGLYIADWVNPLIGHMQFNLRDPRRDHSHGRIYRVTHKENPVLEKIDLTKLDIAGLLEVIKTTTEQNTRDRARRLLQVMDKDAVVAATNKWVFEELDPRAREYDYELMTLEALWIQQAYGVYDVTLIDEVTRAREPMVLAGAIRALRYGLQFGDLATSDAKSFIARAISDRDMRVRLEAVMACAFLDSPDAADIANRVTTEEMDGPIRNAHQQTIKYLNSKGITSVAGLPAIYALPKDKLLAELKKKTGVDPLVPLAAVARDDLSLDDRREALGMLADTPEKRAKQLMQVTKIQVFDPARTANAIDKLLLELPGNALLAVNDDLDALLDSQTPGLRSAAVALKVKSAAPLGTLADRDPAALLDAVGKLSEAQTPASLPAELIDLAETGKLDAGTAIVQANRLSTDKAALFTRLAALADPAMEVTYDQWGDQHVLAMAALAGMHETADEDWPEGFDQYRIARADEATLQLGKDIYFYHDQGCYKCHGEKGEGTSGFPPLAYSPTLVGDPVRAANILKYGLQGELTHTLNPDTGQPFNAQMEPLSQFNDAEMAAALTYVRQSFGNFSAPVTIDDMKKARQPNAEKGEGENMWDAAALLAKYPFERDRLTGPLPAPSIQVYNWKPPASGLILMLGFVTLCMLLILGSDITRPNVIVILCDDLGQGDPGCYNPDSKIPTPHIDRLAKEGLRFNDAHTPSSVCTPTRYSTLTGRYCWRTDLKQGVLWNGWAQALIEEDRPTIASMLKPYGYHSAAVGKWHLGWNWHSKTDKPITERHHPDGAVDYSKKVMRGPLTLGFDHSYLIPASLDMAPYLYLVDDLAMDEPTAYTERSEHRRKGGEGFWRAGPMQPGFDFYGFLPATTEAAVAYIDRRAAADRAGQGKPFFLYFPLPAPHTPWTPSKEFQGDTEVGWYGDFVAQTDWSVGRVLAALDRNGIAENTIVVFTSDNGSHWPNGDIKKWGHDANNGWRGQKADIYEGGHRVPFLIRWPDGIKPGSVSDQTVCLTDLYATVAEIVGHPLADDECEDGISMLPIFKGVDEPIREATVHHSLSGMFAIRRGDWKLVLGLGSGGFSQPRQAEPKEGGPLGQLYNLKDDPQEKNNLWQDKPEIVAELTALLEKYKAEGRSR